MRRSSARRRVWADSLGMPQAPRQRVDHGPRLEHLPELTWIARVAGVASPVCIACQSSLSGPATLTSHDRLYGSSDDVYEVAICRSCGAGTTFPTLPESELFALYPSHYSAYQAGTSLLSQLVAIFMGIRSRRTLAKPPFASLGLPANVLDVGCGRGDLGASLAKAGWSVDGVEPSSSACTIACSRGVNALQGTLSTVDLESERYSAVIFSHSLEHVADPRETLRRSADLLRPGGLVVISVPNFASWQRRYFGSAWFGLDLPRHRAHFTPQALSRLVVDAGLEVIQTTTTTSAVGLPASLQYRVFGRCMFRDGLRFYLANAVAIALQPMSVLVDGLLGSRDYLHVVACRPVGEPAGRQLG
jgi:2-polyprenyl-3-methyl-5-hydroxy-6-metoxy-1,4-benzoquinol methylase